MDDLEDRIAAWVDASIDGVDPVTVDDVLARSAADIRVLRATSRRPRIVAAVAAAVVLLAGAIAVVALDHREPEPVTTLKTAEPHWVRTTIDPFGWTISRPADWTLQPWDSCGNESGRIISNHSKPLRHHARSNGCTSPWHSPDLADRRLAAVEVIHDGGGGFPNPNAPARWDTDLPIAADELSPTGERLGVHATVRSLPVLVEGRSYLVRTILGPDASRADRAAIRRMLASINWPVAHSTAVIRRSPARWPDTPTTRRGPSQSPADARRDGIIPALAALPLGRRATPVQGARASEGDWWIADGGYSSPPADTSGGIVGDPNGVDGIDRITPREYGELLLLGRDGVVLRAYPSPNDKLSWITLTHDAVLVGHIGDGGEPSSTIMRIDRHTLRATTVIFPCRCADGADPFRLPAWIAAPSDVPIASLVTSGSRAVGTPVPSWIGTVRVDLAGIDALFERVGH